MPRSVGAFADEAHWIEATGAGAPKEGPAKFWRDNEAIWNQEKSTYRYLTAAGSLDLTGPEAYSHETFSYLSAAAAQFYRTFRRIRVIPALRGFDLSREEAQRISFFETGTGSRYPITAPFPDNMAIRFNHMNQPEAFFIYDYVRENPLVWTPADNPTLADSEFIAAVEAVMASGMSDGAKVAAIREIAKR
jgi:hypothetical protein